MNRCDNLSEAVSLNQRHGGNLFSAAWNLVAADTTKIYGEPGELEEEPKQLGAIFKNLLKSSSNIEEMLRKCPQRQYLVYITSAP